MPPSRRIMKEDIVRAGYEIARRDGPDGINARAIAKALGCSVQPIFSNFGDMQALKEAVMEKARSTYHAYMEQGTRDQKPYKGLGMAYIRFAREEPELFRMMFMGTSNVAFEKYMELDQKSSLFSVEYGMRATGLNEEQMKRFHRNVYVFTHGLAVLASRNTCIFDDRQISDMLTDMFQGQMALFGKERHREERH